MNPKILSSLTLIVSLSFIAAGCTKTETVSKPKPTSNEVKQSVTVANPATTTPGVAPTTKPTTTATKKTAVAPAPTTKPTTQQEKIANQMAPVTAYVTIKDGAFSPQVITVKAGGTVIWTNKDSVAHTTKSDGTLLWDSGTIQAGGTYRHTFKAVGNYPYSCSIHPSMKGTVYVY